MSDISIADYLNQLVTDKATLVSNLQAKGVSLTGDETFTEIAPAINTLPAPYAPKFVSFYNYPGTYNDLMSDMTTLNMASIIQAPQIYPLNFDINGLNLGSIWSNNPSMTSTADMFSRRLKNYQYSNDRLKGVVTLNNFDMSHVTNMSYMFYNCEYVTEIDMGNCSATNVDLSYAFALCSRLTTMDLGTWCPKVAKDSSNRVLWYTFGNMNVSGSGLVSELDVTNLKDSLVDLTGTVNVVDTFRNTYIDKIKGLNLWKSNPNVDQFNMDSMFYGSRVSEVDFSALKPHNCSCDSLFNTCPRLTKVVLPDFSFRGNGSCFAMFASNTSLTDVDLSNWDTSKVSTFQYMFSNCSALTTLDLSTFTVRVGGTFSSVNQMFVGCVNLRHLDLRSFRFDRIPNSAYPGRMFGTTDGAVTIPTDCEIIVEDDTQKTWMNTKYPTLTNVKTVAEYEAT